MSLKYYKFIVILLILGSSVSVFSQNETRLIFYYSGTDCCSPFHDYPNYIEGGWKSSHGSPNFLDYNRRVLKLSGRNGKGGDENQRLPTTP